MSLVIDLCSGLGGFSQAFRRRKAYEVVTVDTDRSFKPTICADASNLPLRTGLGPRLILASPPCQTFSIMAVFHYWHRGRPGEKARAAGKLVRGILAEIERLAPEWWVMENPDGMLKRIIGRPRWIITLCQYGTSYQKRTALWGNLPDFEARKCKNGAPCHERSPRGFRGGGIQDIPTSAERARLPYGLSREIAEAVS